MALAHTGALAGGAEAYAALFKHYGVSQVKSLDEMMDAIELFSHTKAASGKKLSVLMESGGERSLVADLSADLDIEFARLSSQTESRLLDVLDEGVQPENPLDAFGTGHDVVGVYRECLKAMDADSDTGVVVLAVDLARDSYLSPAYVEALLQAKDSLHKPLVAMVNLTAGANEELMSTLRSNAVPVLMGTRNALKAIAHWAKFGTGDSLETETPRASGRPSPEILTKLQNQLEKTRDALDEHDSKCLLNAYGLTTTNEIIVDSLKGAVLLDGVRGKKPVSRKALIDAIMRFSTFIADFSDQLSEVDVNPLLVTTDAAVILDTLVIPRRSVT